MLTVACVCVRGHLGYFNRDYVARLERMARRTIARPFRFVCLTDQWRNMPSSVEPIPIELPPGLKGWWAKVQLFNPALRLSGRVLYLDLDVLLVRSLLPIIDYPAPFVLAGDGAPGFVPANGLATVKRFNSSVMVWHAGAQAHLFEAWTPAVAERLWGDQDWIGERCPGAAALPLDWTPRISSVRPPWPQDARVVLVKKPKNHEAARRWPWFRQLWG